jgi:hypothetical protein
MLISMPTGTSTIFGVFQDISVSLQSGTTARPRPYVNALQKLRQRFIFPGLLLRRKTTLRVRRIKPRHINGLRPCAEEFQLLCRSTASKVTNK